MKRRSRAIVALTGAGSSQRWACRAAWPPALCWRGPRLRRPLRRPGQRRPPGLTGGWRVGNVPGPGRAPWAGRSCPAAARARRLTAGSLSRGSTPSWVISVSGRPTPTAPTSSGSPIPRARTTTGHPTGAGSPSTSSTRPVNTWPPWTPTAATCASSPSKTASRETPSGRRTGSGSPSTPRLRSPISRASTPASGPCAPTAPAPGSSPTASSASSPCTPPMAAGSPSGASPASTPGLPAGSHRRHQHRRHAPATGRPAARGPGTPRLVPQRPLDQLQHRP